MRRTGDRGCVLRESGVSPVIGVMLMIVVTIIIAAIVSAFAGGMGTSVKPAPNAAFDFKIYEKFASATGNSPANADPLIFVSLKNGETMDTADLKILSSHYVNGQRVTYTFDPTSNRSQAPAEGAYGRHGGLVTFTTGGRSLGWGVKGTYLHQGDRFVGYTCTVLGLGPQPPSYSSCNTYGPKAGDIFHIEVVYKPTNSVIYSEDVTTI